MLALNLFKRFSLFSKICNSPKQAIEGIKDGSFLLVGGFGIAGVPMNLINAVRQSKVKDLIVASNNGGYGDKDGKMDWGLSLLMRTRQIKKMIASYVGKNVQFERQFFSGELEFEICPQGTLVQKIRAGGAGIPAFYTATGVDTLIQKGGFPIKYEYNGRSDDVKKGKIKPIIQIISEPRPSAEFNGKKYILQKSLFGDFALVKAKRADKLGNLQFQKSQRNFNADVATAAKCVIAEVEQIVEIGELDPQCIHVPAVYVDRVYKSDPKSEFSEIVVEKVTIKGQAQTKIFVKQSDLRLGKITFAASIEGKRNKNTYPLRLKIATRAAKQVKNGMNVNLGIGIPTLLPLVLPEGVQINLQSQNGIMRVGQPYPALHEATGRIINAGRQTITMNPGGSYSSSSQSFAIIRGGHLDMTMLGAFEVSLDCNITNWIIPGKMMNGIGMGGAMDLVACGSKVIVLMEHSAQGKDGTLSHKLLQDCKLPLTAKGVVSKVITQLAVFQNMNGKLVLTEIANETTLEEVQKQTGFKIEVAEPLGRF